MVFSYWRVGFSSGEKHGSAFDAVPLTARHQQVEKWQNPASRTFLLFSSDFVPSLRIRWELNKYQKDGCILVHKEVRWTKYLTRRTLWETPQLASVCDQFNSCLTCVIFRISRVLKKQQRVFKTCRSKISQNLEIVTWRDVTLANGVTAS